MEHSTSSVDMAVAKPTKQFFVYMLTRDISLADAILDLVDNCIDGALRLARGGVVDYSRYFVKIDLNNQKFTITDNCGGIPRDIAKNYAFKIGRDADDVRDPNVETIGMYGVGMKRAIFKMGRHAVVATNYEDDKYHVIISSEWLDSRDWESLPITDSTNDFVLNEHGTNVVVSELYSGVATHFGNPAFVNNLISAISEHFTIFIQRGLTIEVNGQKVSPVKVEVLMSEDIHQPAPYVFYKKIHDVTVSIVVGMNTGRIIYDDDEDGEDFDKDRSAETAGWTVFCNDRAVIVGDKSRLTGWGDDLPMYHGQFSVITGIVEFRSMSAEKLPITTTKRALDTASDIWLEARSKMREGLRVWINHTNKWKNHPRSDQRGVWENATAMPLNVVMEKIKLRDITLKEDESFEYNPSKKGVLPNPPSSKPSSKRIVFSRPIEEIKYLSTKMFDNAETHPGIIGDKCFEYVYGLYTTEEDKKR